MLKIVLSIILAFDIERYRPILHYSSQYVYNVDKTNFVTLFFFNFDFV